MKPSIALGMLLFATPAFADDWPQWMGPKRDNVWRESGLIDKFPAGGPKVVWRTPVAGGFAGPAVANGRVYVTDYVTAEYANIDNFRRKTLSGTERVLCLDEATGDVKWKHEYPVKYTISYPAGPRCTPTVHARKVYTLGAEGNLICLSADSGSLIWQQNLPEEYHTKTALWGYASHPLIDGQKLITVVGGEGSHVVAFDKDTGKELWRSQTCREQGYCPPVVIEANGKRQLIQLRPDALVSLNPENGELNWSVPYDATNGCVIMTPIKCGDYIYAGGFSDKNLLVKLTTDKPEVVWHNKKGIGLSPVNVQPFLSDKILYGFDQNGEMMAVELPDGKRLWNTTVPIDGKKPLGSGTAFVIHEGNHYWLFNEKGELIIAKLSPKGYEEVDRAKLLEPTGAAFGRSVVWCSPAFADKRMFVRNDKECICVDLAK